MIALITWLWLCLWFMGWSNSTLSSIDSHSYVCKCGRQEMQAHVNYAAFKVQVWWTCKFVSHKNVWPIEDYVTAWTSEQTLDLQDYSIAAMWSRLHVYIFVAFHVELCFLFLSTSYYNHWGVCGNFAQSESSMTMTLDCVAVFLVQQWKQHEPCFPIHIQLTLKNDSF